MSNNAIKCSCPIKDCHYHNNCQECIAHHVGKKVPVYCIKKTMERQ